MIVDANILLYAVDTSSTHHERAASWMEDQLNADSPIAFPWPSLLAFMRISTGIRTASPPIASKRAWAFVTDWLESPVAWIPSPTPRHVEIFASLVEKYEISGNLVPDAHLAAYAIEHGVPLASADTDFARFTEVRWINPVGR